MGKHFQTVRSHFLAIQIKHFICQLIGMSTRIILQTKFFHGNLWQEGDIADKTLANEKESSQIHETM